MDGQRTTSSTPWREFHYRVKRRMVREREITVKDEGKIGSGAIKCVKCFGAANWLVFSDRSTTATRRAASAG